MARSTALGRTENIDNGSSNEEKVALFRELFFGRQDVLLQSGGYKVFRFLAEDVCEDLTSVLDGIQYNWGNRA